MQPQGVRTLLAQRCLSNRPAVPNKFGQQRLVNFGNASAFEQSVEALARIA
jgi:hypothetical protein